MNSIGQYNLIRQIAAGGEADLWLANHGNDQKICLKIMRNNTHRLTNFFEGAKILSRLEHPNIVKLIDYGRHQNIYFIALEYIEGQNLHELRVQYDQQNQWFPLELALHITSSLCEAIAHAHQRQIIHGDISLRNIMIQGNSIKLIDFLSSTTKLNTQSDIFSIGNILYQLVTGTSLLPYAPSYLNPHLTPELDQIVMKALHPTRREHYKNADEMREELAQLRITL